jgi:hypothetical protein
MMNAFFDNNKVLSVSDNGRIYLGGHSTTKLRCWMTFVGLSFLADVDVNVNADGCQWASGGLEMDCLVCALMPVSIWMAGLDTCYHPDRSGFSRKVLESSTIEK